MKTIKTHISFREKTFCEEIFSYLPKRAIINSRLKRNALPDILFYVARHLYFLYQDGKIATRNEIVELLKRYVYFLTYANVTVSDGNKVQAFEKMLETGCTLEGLYALSESDGFFGELLKCSSSTNEGFYRDVVQKAHYDLGETPWIKDTLYMCFWFFKQNLDLKYYTGSRDSRVCCDLVVAKAIQSPPLLEYEIEIIDKENFYLNLTAKKYGEEKYFAHFIHCLFLYGKTNDFDGYYLPFKSAAVYLIAGNKNITLASLAFLSKGGEDAYQVRKDLIIPFAFRYNGKEYVFEQGKITAR